MVKNYMWITMFHVKRYEYGWKNGWFWGMKILKIRLIYAEKCKKCNFEIGIEIK